jgi:hypothetical protein
MGNQGHLDLVNPKIPLPSIDNPAADTRKFFPPPIDLIHIPHGRKFFGSLEGDLLHSQMLESLPVPGMRHFTFLHAIKVWPLEGDLA